MNISLIIQQFSIEESSAFKSYVRSKNKRHDTKNLELYTLLRKGTSLANIDSILYGKANRNAYHALSKRLQDTLIDFIAIRSFETETSDDIQIFKWILTSRILYEQAHPTLAQKLLKKAIISARQLDLYTALVESYHTQLQYSHLHPDIDLATLTREAQENQRRFIQQENLNMAYAHIKRALIFDEQLIKKGIQKTVEEILAAFNIKIDEHFTFKSLYQLLEIINTAAHLDHNFGEALPFITATYDLIKQKSQHVKRHRFYHIQVLYFMANAQFRVRNFNNATSYLDLMRLEMQAEKEKYELRFRENHLLITSFVLNYTGQAHLAIVSIENHIRASKKQNVDADIVLALVVFLTQQEDFKKALSALNTFRHTDTWYEEHLGGDWMIKKKLLTLIIYYELEYVELVHSHLRRFKRKYASIIKTETRLQHFIKVYTQIFNQPGIVEEPHFRESITTLFATQNLNEEDIFMVSFFAWIKAKLSNASIYETTLSLL